MNAVKSLGTRDSSINIIPNLQSSLQPDLSVQLAGGTVATRGKAMRLCFNAHITEVAEIIEDFSGARRRDVDEHLSEYEETFHLPYIKPKHTISPTTISQNLSSLPSFTRPSRPTKWTT